MDGSVDEISIGVSTANSQYPSASGNGQVLNAGHLYIEFWSNHVPTLGQPIQAGSIQKGGVGWLGSANFFQSVQSQPQAFLGLSPSQASSLAATIEYKKSVYDDNFAAGLTPLYYADRMNSNTWAAGILLASGISQGTVDQIVSKLNEATGGTEYPYGYGNGNQLLQYF